MHHSAHKTPRNHCHHWLLFTFECLVITSLTVRLLPYVFYGVLVGFGVKKGLQSLEFSFEDDSLTHYAGLFLIQRFCHKLNFRRRLQRMLTAAPEGQGYAATDKFLVYLYFLIAGIQRVNRTDKFHYDGFFRALLGLDSVPEETTLRRFLNQLSPDAIRQFVRLHDEIRSDRFSEPTPRTSLEFHLDSVVLTLYGKKQNARKGYNPKAKGRPSFHPILCFESHGQEFWHGSLRPGDAGSNTGARFLIKRILAKVPKHIHKARIRFLMDSGFFSGALMHDLDEQGCMFTIVARDYPLYRSKAEEAGYKDLNHGWGVAEFKHKAQKWKKEFRFIVVRRPLPEDPEEAKQLTLFKDQNYSYSVLVTNQDLGAWRIWTDYVDRSNIEKSIRELLNDLALSKIPSETWTANVAFLQILLLAYNILHWFKRFLIPEESLGVTASTLRHELLEIPGQLINRSGRNVLAMPENYPGAERFLKIAQRLKKLKLPGGL